MRSLILIVIFTVIFSNAQENDDRNDTSFSNSIRNFQLNLLYRTGTELNQHLVMAPISVWSLMSVLTEGTAGETNKQLRRYIGKIVSRKFSHESFAHVIKFFQQKSTVTIERTSTLFHNASISLIPDFVNEVTKSYGTHVEKIDVSRPRVAALQINDYFRRATHGRIREVVYPDDLSDGKVILAENLYFKGSWTKPFNASETMLNNFYNDAGQVIGQVNMMYQRASLGIASMKTLRGHVIELPYGDRDQFVMLVILPYHGVSLFELYPSFHNISFSEIFARFKQDKLEYGTDDVDVWLPRFKINTVAHLVMPLAIIGIQNIFKKDSDFSRMTNDPMFVTNVIHMAEIEVTEEGTVASAVTGSLLSHLIAVPKFRADRPFIFVILEKVSETILFSGIYSQPSLF